MIDIDNDLDDDLEDWGPAEPPPKAMPEFAHNYVTLTLARIANAIHTADMGGTAELYRSKYGDLDVAGTREWLRREGWNRLSDISTYIDIPNECQYKAWLAVKELQWQLIDKLSTAKAKRA